MPAVTWHGKNRSKTGDGKKQPEWAGPTPQVSVRAARTDGFVQLVPELPKMPRCPWMGAKRTLSGQFITTSAEVTPNGCLVRESPKYGLESG